MTQRKVSLATSTYGSGRMAFIPGRLNSVCTGGDGVSANFIRRLLSWISMKDVDKSISAGVIGLSDSVESIDYGFNKEQIMSISRVGPEYLSLYSKISKFDCLIIEGAGSSSISPLSKTNLLSYVNAGKGLLLLDFYSSGYVSVVPSGYEISVSSVNTDVEGKTIWTDLGRSSELYSTSISDVNIPLVDTVYDDEISNLWNVLCYCGEIEDIKLSEDKSDDLHHLPSTSYSFPGEYFIGRFSTSYQDGIIDVQV